jgi:hypothetical protein
LPPEFLGQPSQGPPQRQTQPPINVIVNREVEKQFFRMEWDRFEPEKWTWQEYRESYVDPAVEDGVRDSVIVDRLMTKLPLRARQFLRDGRFDRRNIGNVVSLLTTLYGQGVSQATRAIIAQEDFQRCIRQEYETAASFSTRLVSLSLAAFRDSHPLAQAENAAAQFIAGINCELTQPRLRELAYRYGGVPRVPYRELVARATEIEHVYDLRRRAYGDDEEDKTESRPVVSQPRARRDVERQQSALNRAQPATTTRPVAAFDEPPAQVPAPRLEVTKSESTRFEPRRTEGTQNANETAKEGRKPPLPCFYCENRPLRTAVHMSPAAAVRFIYCSPGIGVMINIYRPSI